MVTFRKYKIEIKFKVRDKSVQIHLKKNIKLNYGQKD